MSGSRRSAGTRARPPLGGPLAWTVAWRFLRGRRSRLLGGTARAALAAVALGVTAMVIAMALMTGYREDLERKLIEGNAPIVASPLSRHAAALDAAALARLEAIPGVERVGRVSYGQGALDVPGRAAGGASAAGGAAAGALEVTLRGIDPGGGQLAASAGQLGADADGVPGAVLGGELANRLGVADGDRVRLVALGFDADGRPRFRFQSLRVAGTFATGFAEFDGSWLLLDRALVNRLMGDQGAVDLYEFTLGDAVADAARVVAAVRGVLEPDYLVTDWRQLNQELFTALEVQQYALFLALGLIVLVSTFNVASTLVVLVRERMRDLGVLLTLGFAPRSLRAAFLAYGALLGGAGTAIGVAVGVAASWTLTTFDLIRFDAEVAAIYFISSVPFRVEAADVAAVVVFSLAVTLAACILPSRRALRIDPAAALRYE